MFCINFASCCTTVASLLPAVPLQVAASERLAEVWVQLAGELGASPDQLAAVRTDTRGMLMTAAQPPVMP